MISHSSTVASYEKELRYFKAYPVYADEIVDYQWAAKFCNFHQIVQKSHMILCWVAGRSFPLCVGTWEAPYCKRKQDVFGMPVGFPASLRYSDFQQIASLIMPSLTCHCTASPDISESYIEMKLKGTMHWYPEGEKAEYLAACGSSDLCFIKQRNKKLGKNFQISFLWANEHSLPFLFITSFTLLIMWVLNVLKMYFVRLPKQKRWISGN